MSAELESGFFVRFPAWHGLGTVISEAPNSEEALKIAGLDWEVEQAMAFAEMKNGMMKETNFVMNYRSTDEQILGIVRDQYKVVQNKDAFAFTDSLLDTGEVTYETAGSLQGGKRVWMLAKLPEQSILGESHVPYLLFSNSHAGSSAVRVTITNTRVVCQNTLNIALSQAPRIWSCAHKGDMENKLEEARRTLQTAMNYMNEFKIEAERLAVKKFSPQEVRDIIDKLFPIDTIDMGKRKVNNIIYLRNGFETA